MAISFNYELNNKPNKLGKYQIFLRITEGRKMKRVKSSIQLARAADWNKEKQKVRASEKNAAVWNSTLEAELEEAKQLYRSMQAEGSATSSQLQKKLSRKEDKPYLLAYSNKVRQDLFNAGKLGTWKKYGSFVLKLEAYLKEELKVQDVTFPEVTADFVNDFTNYLRKLKNYRDKETSLHPNTIAKLLKVFRHIMKKAETEKGYIKPENNPFASIAISEEKAIKEKLSEKELAALEAVDLEEGSLMWHAKNAFMFSYYCAGIRAGDLIQLKWANISEGRLAYQMGKNHKGKDVILVPQAQAILQLYWKEGVKPADYIFPYLDNKAKYAKYITQAEKDVMPLQEKKRLFDTINAMEVQINKQLNKAAALAGIDKHISFHISRHSFAKQAKLAGTDNALLQGLMNHSSLSVTERYMKDFDTSREDAALVNIFEGKKKAEEDALLKALKALDKEALAVLLNKLSANE